MQGVRHIPHNCGIFIIPGVWSLLEGYDLYGPIIAPIRDMERFGSDRTCVWFSRAVKFCQVRISDRACN